MAKKKNPHILRSKPLTPAALREFGGLDELSLPSGTFDPGGHWKHTYQIWTVSRHTDYCGGFLRIERRPALDSQSVELSVEKSILQTADTVHKTKATVRCAANILLTPRSWQIESVVVYGNGKPFNITRMAETATVKNGTIELKTGKGILQRKVPGAFTSNWSLFDVVQRLGGKDTTPMMFALLEDLDLLKGGHRLSYRSETIDVEMGGKTAQLQGYQQIGDGILPYVYWLDDQHRLIFAISHVVAHIFDPDAEQRMDKVLKARLQLNKKKRMRRKR